MGRVFFNTRKNVHDVDGAYTMLASDSGKVFTLSSTAGACEITLLPAASLVKGWNCKLIVKEDTPTGVITVAAGSAITFSSGSIVTMDQGVGVAVAAGAGITVVGNYVSLGSTIANAVTVGTAVTFLRYQGGYDAFIYGVSNAAAAAADSTQYEVASSGWVGVQTYTDSSGNLRVKIEVLASLSGITTADTPIYPGYPNGRGS